MPRVKIPYSVVRNGVRYFQATPEMRKAGMDSCRCGPEGSEAQKVALDRYEAWLKWKQESISGRAGEIEPSYEPGTVGHAWKAYSKIKKPTAEWERGWKFIKPVFAHHRMNDITIVQLHTFRQTIADEKSEYEAWRTIKVWRAFWAKAALLKYCNPHLDPSKAFPNPMPKGRSETWTEGEISQIAKQAWRDGYYALATILSVMWDTMFSPKDVWTLTLSQLDRDADGAFFKTSRAKTGQETVGTLTRRSERVLAAYLEKLEAAPLPDQKLFMYAYRGRMVTYDKNLLAKHFRWTREKVFPGDKRQMRDIRRSGTVEAVIGEVNEIALATKMANSINESRHLMNTYNPSRAETVRLADRARIKGRAAIRNAKK